MWWAVLSAMSCLVAIAAFVVDTPVAGFWAALLVVGGVTGDVLLTRFLSRKPAGFPMSSTVVSRLSTVVTPLLLAWVWNVMAAAEDAYLGAEAVTWWAVFLVFTSFTLTEAVRELQTSSR